MSKHKTKPLVTIRVRVFGIVSDAVEEGIARGWRRVHKHNDNPDEGMICSEIYRAVISELCDVLDFGDSDRGDG